MYTTAEFMKVEPDLVISKDEYEDFYYELQVGVLLSLVEDGKLTQMQYNYAEKALKEQRLSKLQRKVIKGDAV